MLPTLRAALFTLLLVNTNMSSTNFKESELEGISKITTRERDQTVPETHQTIKTSPERKPGNTALPYPNHHHCE
jgi:hypothetical protein